MAPCRRIAPPTPCECHEDVGLNSQSAGNSADIASLIQQAQESTRQGAWSQAATLYHRILESSPDNVEALGFLGIQALSAGEFERSAAYFERALQQHPDDASLYKNLGLALRARGAFTEALAAFDQALRRKQEFPVALLHKGAILEHLGRQDEAVSAYVRALAQAEQFGLLLHSATLPDSVRNLLNRALHSAQQAREHWLARALAPVRKRYGSEALRRVDRCLAIHHGREPKIQMHPRQHPTLMTFPDIPAHGWHEHDAFPWMAELERHTDAIRTELLEVLHDDAGFRPFVEIPKDHPGADYWRAVNQSPSWNAFFFFRDGKRFEENHRRCPATSAVLDSLPLIRVAEHSPEVFFSVLKPDTHIPVHTGVINCRLVAHLPLIIPPACGITVGGETRSWREGECMVFDDTFEHEAWNRSDRTRVVLIFDIWNPYLTVAEQAAMRVVVEELGHFNEAHGLKGQIYASS
ncbi:MAG: aspartyl/asparaginyl beta-hydroxylase domain-containing protein [Gammaproteobacteria bacterium]|nr:aspartyl/asparaginyl beta-hydroxylase domain-containing protein [Gammaproteobacteria bacterium]